MKLFISQFRGIKTKQLLCSAIFMLMLCSFFSCISTDRELVVAPEEYLFINANERCSYEKYKKNDADNFSELIRICDLKYYKKIEQSKNHFAYTMFNTEESWVFVLFINNEKYSNKYYSIDVDINLKSPIDEFDNALGENIDYIFNKCKNDNSMYFYKTEEPTSSIHIFEKSGYYIEYENYVVTTIKKFTL